MNLGEDRNSAAAGSGRSDSYLTPWNDRTMSTIARICMQVRFGTGRG